MNNKMTNGTVEFKGYETTPGIKRMLEKIDGDERITIEKLGKDIGEINYGRKGFNYSRRENTGKGYSLHAVRLIANREFQECYMTYRKNQMPGNDLMRGLVSVGTSPYIFWAKKSTISGLRICSHPFFVVILFPLKVVSISGKVYSGTLDSS